MLTEDQRNNVLLNNDKNRKKETYSTKNGNKRKCERREKWPTFVTPVHIKKIQGTQTRIIEKLYTQISKLFKPNKNLKKKKIFSKKQGGNKSLRLIYIVRWTVTGLLNTKQEKNFIKRKAQIKTQQK